jgi:hypothetical protein
MSRTDRVGRVFAHFDEGSRIGDDVIGSERYDYRIVAALVRKCRSGGDRWPRIAPQRFEQNIGLDADLCELLGDEKAILRIGHDDGSAEHGAI